MNGGRPAFTVGSRGGIRSPTGKTIDCFVACMLGSLGAVAAVNGTFLGVRACDRSCHGESSRRPMSVSQTGHGTMV